jgi:mannose-6-phosphate isomerase-like protein (cupin superfamily)
LALDLSALPSPPGKDNPVWTAANGVVVPRDAGITRRAPAAHEIFTVKLTGEQSGGRLSFMEGVISPDHGNIGHVHTRADEAFYIISGEWEFLNGDQKVEVSPGDFMFVPQGTRHGFKNVSSEPARLLVFYTPAGTEKWFLEVGDDQKEAGAWNADVFKGLADKIAAHSMILLPGDDWD